MEFTSQSGSSKKGFPQIGHLSPISKHEYVSKLSRSFVGSNLLGEQQLQFSPPKITAFRPAEVGPKGSLFNTSNERIQADIQAQLVENRVKVLQKEEQRMLNKIQEARMQAMKMQMIKQEQNQRLMHMMDFRQMQADDEERQRQKNNERKASMGHQYQKMKESVLNQNREAFQTMRDMRQMCLEEKNIFKQAQIDAHHQMYAQQREREQSLKRQFEKQKQDRMNLNKSRYDEVTQKHNQEYQAHQKRLQEAAAMEEKMMAKLNQTMKEQHKAISDLTVAISENKIPKGERLGTLNAKMTNMVRGQKFAIPRNTSAVN